MPYNPRPKTYSVTHNVGSVKYLLTFYTGDRHHPDGSLAQDIDCHSNKQKLAAAIRDLERAGYERA